MPLHRQPLVRCCCRRFGFCRIGKILTISSGSAVRRIAYFLRGDFYAEVAHEAIFGQWDKLRAWLTASVHSWFGERQPARDHYCPAGQEAEARRREEEGR
jgi:hypothetical protein